MQNVGGRLLLKYDGSKGKECLNKDMWLFYLDDRLHPAGYGEENNLEYCPPEGIYCVTKSTHFLFNWYMLIKNMFLLIDFSYKILFQN